MCVSGCTCTSGSMQGLQDNLQEDYPVRVLRTEPWLSGSSLASPKGPILETFQAVSGIPFCFDDLSLNSC